MEIRPSSQTTFPCSRSGGGIGPQGQALRVAYGHPCSPTHPPGKRTVESVRKNGIFDLVKGNTFTYFALFAVQ